MNFCTTDSYILKANVFDSYYDFGFIVFKKDIANWNSSRGSDLAPPKLLIIVFISVWTEKVSEYFNIGCQYSSAVFTTGPLAFAWGSATLDSGFWTAG